MNLMIEIDTKGSFHTWTIAIQYTD